MDGFFTYAGYYFVFLFLQPHIPTVFKLMIGWLKTYFTQTPQKWTNKYGQWAVITGSTDGIGKGYAIELARRGLDIVLISRNQEKLDKVATEIRNTFHVQTKTVKADFKDGPSIYENIKQELSGLEIGILVNNVGMAVDRPHPISDGPVQLCWDMMYVNIGSVVMMTNLILPQMKKRKKGAIINISSGSEAMPLTNLALYSPSKALVKHFSQLLQIETEYSGIEVQLVSPLAVKTNMVKPHPIAYNLNAFWLPDAETYARRAIKTLGFSKHTTGDWTKDFLYFPIQLVPVEISARVVKLVTDYMWKKIS